MEVGQPFGGGAKVAFAVGIGSRPRGFNAGQRTTGNIALTGDAQTAPADGAEWVGQAPRSLHPKADAQSTERRLFTLGPSIQCCETWDLDHHRGGNGGLSKREQHDAAPVPLTAGQQDCSRVMLGQFDVVQSGECPHRPGLEESGVVRRLHDRGDRQVRGNNPERALYCLSPSLTWLRDDRCLRPPSKWCAKSPTDRGRLVPFGPTAARGPRDSIDPATRSLSGDEIECALFSTTLAPSP